MKPALILGMTMLILRSEGVQAQQAGTSRTDLQRHDLSSPGREVVQVRVEFEPGYLSPTHTHHGEEIIYVLEGVLEYRIAGRPPVTLKAGEVLFVPAGIAHAAKNIGTTKGAELATYIVEKGKPLVTIVERSTPAAVTRPSYHLHHCPIEAPNRHQ